MSRTASRSSLRSRFTVWLRALLSRRRFESEMEEEMRFHMDEHARGLVERGVPAAEAQRQARIAFGGRESSRDSVRSAVGLRPFDELVADLRYALRVLRNSPGFTLIAAGSLALAIGANTTIFSVAHFMLLQRLAVPHADELRMLYRDDDENSAFHMSWGSSFRADNGRYRADNFTYPIYRQMQREEAKSGLDLVGFKDLENITASFGGNAQAVHAELVSGNFYPVMRAAPYLGRVLQPSDDGAPGSGAVAVVSYSFWQGALGGAPDVVGKVLRLDSTPVTIVGVNAKSFTGAERVQRSPEVFLPMSMMATLRGTLGPEHVLQSTSLSWVQILLRKPDGVSDAVLHSRLDHSFHTAVLATITPAATETVPHVAVEDGSRGLAQTARLLRKPLSVLLGLVLCVLLLACANIANLMLARARARQREISVRLALGAGRARIFRQLLVESLVLAAAGGAAGTLLGFVGRSGAAALLEPAWQQSAVRVPFHWPVFAFSVAATLCTGILFGLAPAWQSTRTDVNTGLKQSSHSASRQRRAWTGKGLVGFQVAMATLLVVGSALFARTVRNLSAVQPGFDPHGVLLFHVQPPDKQYAGKRAIALHRELVQRFAAVPGVEGVSTAVVPLVAQSMWTSGIQVEGVPKPAEKASDRATGTNFDMVSPDFFSVLRIPLVAGRPFTAADTVTSPRVAVVNQAFVQKFLQGKDPIGMRISGGDEEEPGTGSKTRTPAWTTIVGVCADTQYSDLRSDRGPIYFTDVFQSRDHSDSALGSSYLVRSTATPESLVPVLRQAALQVDPDLPLIDVRTQEQQIAEVSRQERMFASLTAGFGLLALLLACVGIYGVMAYTVSQRTHEIGIRLALGAKRSRVRGMVLREATWLTLAGVVAGLAAALALARLVASLLYNLKPYDPPSLALSALLLLGVALLSSWLPAARAARLEPVIALRQD